MAALPTTGITTSKVAQAIGVGSNDVGTLCISNKINKWSKWKPIQSSKVTGLTLTDLQNANYGFTIPVVESGALAYTELAYTWVYKKPTGGATSPYRLGDFRGYDHNAIRPFNISIPSYLKEGGTNNKVKITFPTIGDGNVDSDFFMSDKYFGVLLKGAGIFEYKTASLSIEDGGHTVDLSDSSFLALGQNVDLYCMLSDGHRTTWWKAIKNNLYSLNGDAGIAYKSNLYVYPLAKYTIGFSGIAPADITAIALHGVAVVSGGKITRQATLSRQVKKEYFLDHIEVNVTKHNSGTSVYNGNFATDSNSSPMDITTDLPAGCDIEFRSTLYKEGSDFSELEGTDYYDINYNFVFVE